MTGARLISEGSVSIVVLPGSWVCQGMGARDLVTGVSTAGGCCFLLHVLCWKWLLLPPLIAGCGSCCFSLCCPIPRCAALPLQLRLRLQVVAAMNGTLLRFAVTSPFPHSVSVEKVVLGVGPFPAKLDVRTELCYVLPFGPRIVETVIGLCVLQSRVLYPVARGSSLPPSLMWLHYIMSIM